MARNPTCFPTPLSDTCKLLLGDGSGYAIQASCTGSAPTTADIFQHGCLMYQTDTSTGTGAVYQNIGSTAVPSWSLLDTASSSFTLPVAATDASTTTGNSFALTQNAVTTGKGIVTTVNGLTTGKGIEVTHTTSVIASGGTLLNLSSTGVDTATTSGALLNLTSTSGVAATQVLGTFGVTTGIGQSIVVDSLTSGQGLKIGSSATAITGNGRLFLSNHSGATGTSAILNEFASAANDETIVAQVTASAANALGVALKVATASTTGTGLAVAATAGTTGGAVTVTDSSADTGTRSAVTIAVSNASASGATPLTITAANATVPLIAGTATVQSTHFFRFAKVNGVTLWIGDGTTANSALSGTAGDMLLNGGSGKPEYCTGTTNWTALV